MSITTKNGSITLKNFAELGSVLDPESLPPGPEAVDDEPTHDSQNPHEATNAQTPAPRDLASLLAQLSTISTGLDTMARQDAHARDQAELDLHQALAADQLDDAQRLLEPLMREFSDNAEVRRRADALRWRLGQRLIAPAENALQAVVRRPYRDDPEAAVHLLADICMDNLPEDLGRRIFGLWSNACYRLVELRGWHDPKRHAPFTSRGMVFARPTPEGPDTIVSSLGMPEWRPDDLVTDVRVLRASRPLKPAPAR